MGRWVGGRMGSWLGGWVDEWVDEWVTVVGEWVSRAVIKVVRTIVVQ